VELVLGDVGELHRRDQQPFRHCFLPGFRDRRLAHFPAGTAAKPQ
jgi:hypothetical protein